MEHNDTQNEKNGEPIIKELENSKETLLYDVDNDFHDTYNTGIKLSKTPDRGNKRRLRFYNLINMYKFTHTLKGDVIECGTWKGLSSFLICEYIKRELFFYKGANYHIVDSFEGISVPQFHDTIKTDIVLKGKNRIGQALKNSGAYSAEIDYVKEVLKDFPKINYHKGWIPEILNTLPDNTYKFVHVDLDLYKPILGALKYFYPRLVTGGIIVCDDYGSLFWPGAKKAIEEFCDLYNARWFTLTTGQAVIMSTMSPKESAKMPIQQRLFKTIRSWIGC